MNKEELTQLAQDFKQDWQDIAIYSDQKQLYTVFMVIWDGYKFTVKHLAFSEVSLKKLGGVHAIKNLNRVILRYSRPDLVIDIKTAE